jgi:hypothetical protein
MRRRSHERARVAEVSEQRGGGGAIPGDERTQPLEQIPIADVARGD